MHILYPSQVAFKEEIFKEALKRIGGMEQARLEPMIPSPLELGYRDRIRLLVRGGRVGYRAGESREIVPIDACLLAAEEINLAIPEVEGANEVEIRTENDGIEVIKNPKKTDLPFRQVNPRQNERLVEEVMTLLGLKGGGRILDLFAGNGNFSIPVAQEAFEVVAVELNSTAIREGTARAKREMMSNIAWRKSPVLSALKDFEKRGERFDAVILDPPRRGAKEEVAKISSLQPQKIVYISCDPATLARDIRTLRKVGYALDVVQPIDMFPQTHHIEGIALLKKSRVESQSR